MSENQRRAEDRLIVRDLVIRALTALGLVGAFLALLIMINPN